MEQQQTHTLTAIFEISVQRISNHFANVGKMVLLEGARA